MLQRDYYDSEKEQMKVYNAISAKDHSENQQICKLLVNKLKIKPVKEANTSISVKKKVLKILPMFMKKSKSLEVWDDFLDIFKLYEPICYDFSEEGNIFLHGILECAGDLHYRK